jgi:hypothetical protein
MTIPDPHIEFLSDSLIDEIVKGVGLPETTVITRLFKGFFHRATERLASVGLATDRIITQSGFPTAAGWMLSNWCRQVFTRGSENIPCEGPLLVLSNHVGTYDSVVLAASIGRQDLKIVSNSFPFVMNLPHIADHLIFLTNRMQDRAAGARSAIRQLRQGGAVLMFGSGRLDPDPAVFPQADPHIESWSAAVELFLRAVPDARLVLSMVSGFLSRRWSYHPITWLRRLDYQKRRLAEFGQVLQQLFSPGSFYLTPRISFSAPMTLQALQSESGSPRFLPAVIMRGKALLVDHLNWEKSLPPALEP